MISAALLKRLADLRLSPEKLQEVVAIIAEYDEARETRRQRDRDRKRQSRVRGMSRDSHSDKEKKERSPPIPLSKERKEIDVGFPRGQPTSTARTGDGTPTETAPEEAIAFAAGLGWPPERIAAEWQHFRDWHIAHGKTRKNSIALMAAWRNWCRSPYQQTQTAKYAGAAPRPGSREDRAERTHHALQELRDYIADAEGDGGEAGPPPAGLFPDGDPA